MENLAQGDSLDLMMYRQLDASYGQLITQGLMSGDVRLLRVSALVAAKSQATNTMALIAAIGTGATAMTFSGLSLVPGATLAPWIVAGLVLVITVALITSQSKERRDRERDIKLLESVAPTNQRQIHCDPFFLSMLIESFSTRMTAAKRAAEAAASENDEKNLTKCAKSMHDQRERWFEYVKRLRKADMLTHEEYSDIAEMMKVRL